TTMQTCYRGLRKNGSWFTVEAIAHNLMENPHIKGLVVNYRDVTDRKKAEEALQESERKFATLINNMPGIAYRRLNDKDWTMLFISEGCVQLTGYDCSDLKLNQTISWNSIIHPEDRQRVWDETQKAVSQNESYTLNYRILTKTGETKWVWEQGTGIITDEGANIELEGFITDVTERKQAENILKKSEVNLAKAQEIAQMGSWEWNLETDEPFWSDGAYRIYGYDRSNSESSLELAWIPIHPDDKGWVGKVWKTARNEGTSYNIQYRIIKPDGSERTINGIGESERNSRGKVILLFGTIQDITERKQAEEELRIKDFAFESSLSADSIATNEGFLTYANPAFAGIWGYENVDEVIGKPIVDFLADKDEALEIIESLNSTGKWKGEYTARRKDGSTFIALSSANAVYDEEGNQTALYSSVGDITERKKAEMALRDSTERFYALFHNMPLEGVIYRFIRDLQGEIVDWEFSDINSLGLASVGKKNADEVIGKRASEFFENGVMAPYVELSRQSSKMGQPHLFEIRFESNGRDYLASVFLVGTDHYVSLGLDITERKQAEEQLKSTMDELNRSNQELERFAYVVSHDLQEPLRMVASYVQLLEKRYKDQLDQDANEFIHFAADGAIRMQQMINDILEYSRVGTKGREFESVNLNSVLNQAVTNLGGQIEDSGALITHDELPQVFVDEIQMVQLLQNLIGNAIKFRSEDTPLVHIASLENEAEWTISVKDNGIGIHREHQDKIFAVFRRLHPIGKYPGSGIGLAIAAKLVERHGGKMWVESEPGKGSTFYFSIPKVRPRES
ncbi:MAG: PAS domain S-box protein, partial [Chloroflexi bacterium]|nr:PAS domain S-box protein [Chloroflexota bacterium]